MNLGDMAPSESLNPPPKRMLDYIYVIDSVIDLIIFVIVVIIELFCRLIKEKETLPKFWFLKKTIDTWHEQRLAVSEFLGSKPDNLTFVHNSITGC